MQKSKYTADQIAFAVKQTENGTRAEEVCRKMGISQATLYNWKKKYGGLSVSEVRRLKRLEKENNRLKKLAADLSLDKKMLQEVLRKSPEGRRGRRELADGLMQAYKVSTALLAILPMSSSSYYYRADDRAERAWIKEIAETATVWDAAYSSADASKWVINHKKTYPIYCERRPNLRGK